MPQVKDFNDQQETQEEVSIPLCFQNTEEFNKFKYIGAYPYHMPFCRLSIVNVIL